MTFMNNIILHVNLQSANLAFSCVHDRVESTVRFVRDMKDKFADVCTSSNEVLSKCGILSCTAEQEADFKIKVRLM